MQIGQRLKKIASFVPPGVKMADIGTDHAYLPVYLIKENIVSEAIVTDITDGPLAAAKMSVDQAGFQAYVQIRKGDGLCPIKPGEVNVITIAGMGGTTIAGIIDRSLPAAKAADLLVLQPMGESAALRRFLYQNGWYLADEDLVEEAGHLYQVLLVKKADEIMFTPDDFTLEVGPVLKEKRPEFFKEHLQNIFLKYKHICESMEKSQKAVQSEKYFAAKQLLKQTEVFMKCL